jgi:predicted GIY-YIG superfamily endonuclease
LVRPESDRPKTDVIYKIPCECGKSYIGETGRTLETRLKEHKRNVSNGDPNISKLTEHVSNTDHRIL